MKKEKPVDSKQKPSSSNPKNPENKAPTSEAVQQNKNPWHRYVWEKRFFVAIASIAVLFIAFAVTLYSLDGSLARVYVGNAPVNAGISLKQLETTIKNAADNYSLAITYPDGSHKKYPLSDTGVSVDVEASARSAKRSIDKNFDRRLKWWKVFDIPLETKVDKAKLKTFIDNKATQVRQAPKDAAISISNGAVVITPEAKGNGYTIADAENTIKKAVSNMQTSPLSLKPSTLHPAIAANNLKSSEEKVKNILTQKVIFKLDGRSITASSADIASWIELTPVGYDNTVDVNVDSGKIEKHIDKIVRPYLQPPRSRLITKVSDGYVVLDHGANGIDVVNKKESAANVAKQLLDSKGVTAELSAKYATAKTVEAEAYDKWLVVDTTTKRMYAYEKTNLVKTFLVSAGAPQTPTVTGKFSIYSKLRSQDMRGLNADGSRYFQPNVPYVNYFYQDYAIHGNYWRPTSYFGNINSSHGCVGIVNSDAAWIYNWAPIGTAVIVHS